MKKSFYSLLDFEKLSYSECVCPSCGYRVVKHLGVPCKKFSCPKCGFLLNRVSKEVSEDIKEITKIRVGKRKIPGGFEKYKVVMKKKKEVKELDSPTECVFSKKSNI